MVSPAAVWRPCCGYVQFQEPGRRGELIDTPLRMPLDVIACLTACYALATGSTFGKTTYPGHRIKHEFILVEMVRLSTALKKLLV